MEDICNVLIQKVKEKKIAGDIELLKKACEFASKAHAGQKRVSGEPFIEHPISVALIIVDMELDMASIIAAILHDVVEDSAYKLEDVRNMFGEDVAFLVEGLTKLSNLPYSTKEEAQAENLRRVILAMAKDVRVILIKLADRLHNMRTIRVMPEEKQRIKATESIEIYAPLAHKLGLSQIKCELEDISLRCLKPDVYKELSKGIDQKKKERNKFINDIVMVLEDKVSDLGITNFKVEGRPKHFYSIYKKMVKQNKTLDQIYDLFAVRIIVNTVQECYSVLGMLHYMYTPMPGRVKDYIGMPKPNMYQSLHTTLIGGKGIPFEVQIRTWEMHKIAEVGIAAHWKYKSEGNNSNEMDEKLEWLRNIMDWQNDTQDPQEFINTLKFDLFADQVFVFTPKGDVIRLAAKSTPIDFAYNIHSAIGNKMIGAKVNGKMVNLGYELQNGDIIEIITTKTENGPSRDWLKIVKTSNAKNKINQWFKKENREENIEKGKELFEKELKRHGFTYEELMRPEWINIILKKYNFINQDDIYSSIGYGGITANKIVSRLKEEYRKTLKGGDFEKFEKQSEQGEENSGKGTKKRVPENGIIVEGIENCLVRLSKCCNPLPGDEIIGYITQGKGVSVHRSDCHNVNKYVDDKSRLINVKWCNSDVSKSSYIADITILANDRLMLVGDVTTILSEEKIQIKAMNARTVKNSVAIISVSVDVVNKNQLDKILNKLKKIPGVFDIKRNRS